VEISPEVLSRDEEASSFFPAVLAFSVIFCFAFFSRSFNFFFRARGPGKGPRCVFSVPGSVLHNRSLSGTPSEKIAPF